MNYSATSSIPIKSKFIRGEVALIGAGPGDAELLTIKAVRFLQQANVVIYDRLVSREIVHLTPVNCRRLYVGKELHKQCVSQSQINETLLQHARKGEKVVRLKGGDSFIFGRGSEEVEYLLTNGINCHVIPGITAASGATTYAGIPLTHRDVAHSCSFITGHLKHGNELCLPWHEYAASKQTLVFYMGLSNALLIQQQLRAHGKPSKTPVAIIHRGTQPGQQVWRTELCSLASTIAHHNIRSPSLIVVGDVVNVLADYHVNSAHGAYLTADKQVYEDLAVTQ